MTESGICHRRLAATSLPSASIATLGTRGVFSHLPAAFLPAEPTEARKLPNKANCHIRQIISMTYKVSVRRRGPAALFSGSNAESLRRKYDAEPLGQLPSRLTTRRNGPAAMFGKLRAKRPWVYLTEPRPQGCGQGLVTPNISCPAAEVIRNLDRRLAPAALFSGSNPESLRRKYDAEPLAQLPSRLTTRRNGPAARTRQRAGPFPWLFFGRGRGGLNKITKQSQLVYKINKFNNLSCHLGPNKRSKRGKTSPMIARS